MLVPNRHGTSTDYRYGFNGKEKEDEIKGEGNIYDYGFRIYDPRIGKFLSQDPLAKSFPWYTPYQFAGNRPISSVDLDGLEELDANILRVNDDGTVVLSITITDGSTLRSNGGKVIYNLYNSKGVFGGRFSNESPFSTDIATLFSEDPIGIPSLNDKIPSDPTHYQFPTTLETYSRYAEQIQVIGPRVMTGVDNQIHQENSTFVAGIVIEFLTITAPLTGKPTVDLKGNLGVNLPGVANDKINGKESSPLLFINSLADKIEQKTLQTMETYNQDRNDVKSVLVDLSPNLQEYIGGYENLFKELLNRFPKAEISTTNSESQSSSYSIYVEGKTVGEKLDDTIGK